MAFNKGLWCIRKLLIVLGIVALALPSFLWSSFGDGGKCGVGAWFLKHTIKWTFDLLNTNIIDSPFVGGAMIMCKQVSLFFHSFELRATSKPGVEELRWPSCATTGPCCFHFFLSSCLPTQKKCLWISSANLLIPSRAFKVSCLFLLPEVPFSVTTYSFGALGNVPQKKSCPKYSGLGPRDLQRYFELVPI